MITIYQYKSSPLHPQVKLDIIDHFTQNLNSVFETAPLSALSNSGRLTSSSSSHLAGPGVFCCIVKSSVIRLRHFLVPFSYLLLFLLPSVFSEQQGGLSRRVCLAPGLSCYRGLNAMETKFWLHNVLWCVRVCVRGGQIWTHLSGALLIAFVTCTPSDSATLWAWSTLDAGVIYVIRVDCN